MCLVRVNTHDRIQFLSVYGIFGTVFSDTNALQFFKLCTTVCIWMVIPKKKYFLLEISVFIQEK